MHAPEYDVPNYGAFDSEGNIQNDGARDFHV